MTIWFTRPGAPVEQGWVKRFAAADWTVDFPRGAMASTVTQTDEGGLTVEAHFLRRGDLIGLIYASEDRHSHPARARETRRDYSHCQLRFRWKSTGLLPLDAVNGPTLTIEGRDAAGQPKQSGQARTSSGQGGLRDEQVELPAVMTASQAKQMVESCLSMRWRAADRLKLRLPPTRIGLRPGQIVRLSGEAGDWRVASTSIEGMVTVVEAEVAPVDTRAVPADGGRPLSEPDVPVGRSELMLFEVPAEADAPSAAPKALLAASNEGLWKRLPIELSLAANPLTSMVVGRRAAMGRAETLLEARAPVMVDELSTVTVRLTNKDQLLFNADWDALMSGANLAILGDELIQFGRAERMGDGLFRLSRLLRGRRGTEWASANHAVGDQFCMIDPAALAVAELPPDAIGATFAAVAHGLGDAAPLPQATRTMTGEAMRPPSPCQLSVSRIGADLSIEWVRRSHRHWAWIDGVGDIPDSFPEYYRLEASGPGGTVRLKSQSPTALLSAAQIPGGAGQSIQVSVATVGPAALSQPALATIII